MTDQECMARAIELAKRGRGWTNPNPLVGAVIAKEGRIIGEGWHARCGELHAERNAIRALTEPAEGATLYVTLEPCCHYGRTPPCTEAILEQKIARVVIGSGDPNPKVSGKGAAILRRAGVLVEEGFMREACDRLNPVFFHYITTGNPYVIMKYAMTADGKIAARTGDSKWITGEASRRRVQELRWNCMGIMAGIGTVLADDPLLTVREEGRRNPIRIICDSRLRLPPDSRLCRSAEQYPVIAACSEKILEREDGCRKRKQILEGLGVKVLPVPDSPRHVNLPALMELLGREKIDSILLEGGGDLNSSALRSGIVQEIREFIAPKIFGGGCRTPVEGEGVDHPGEAVLLEMTETEKIEQDLLITWRVRSSGKEKECLQEL